MRALVLLVALTGCSAQLLVPFTAPGVLPYTNIITNQKDTAEVKPIALHTPYTYPFTHHFPTFYNYPYTYNVGGTTLKATEFPFIYQAGESAAPAASAPAVEVARRKRDVDAVKLPLPYMHALPTIAKTTFKTKQLEAKEAATPADTTKLELTTKEHEVAVPALKYVQPVVNYSPYSSFTAPITHSILPYHHPITAPSPITPYAYPFIPAPVINL